MKKMLFGLMLMLPVSTMAAELEMKNGWVRLVPPVSDSSAAYLTLANPADNPVTIVGVDSDAADMTMLHGMRMENGRMVMFALERLEVPAHGEVSLSPGANHVMLVGLKGALAEGEEVHLTLKYADGSTQQLTVRVVDARNQGMGQPMSPGMHHGMGHDSH